MEPTTQDHIIRFTTTFNAILFDICHSETPEDPLDELVHFLDDNQDIINDTGRDSFYTHLENIMLEWYTNGLDIIEDYYDIFFGQEFPTWAFEDYCEGCEDCGCDNINYPGNNYEDNYNAHAAPAA